MTETTTTEKKNCFETREQYLLAAVDKMHPLFERHGYKVPKVRVAVGWPSVRATAAKNRRIGECWDNIASSDNVHQIFISPCLGDALGECGALSTLAHEVVHAVVGIKAGHKGPFSKLARAIGLQGKLTATHAGPELLVELKSISDSLGEYPHAQLNPRLSGKKKQTTRMIKCVCAQDEEEGYVARTSKKWLDEFGAPLCPCHKEAMKYELPETEELDEVQYE